MYIGGAALFLGVILYVPFLRQVFHFGVPHRTDIMVCAVAGVLSIAWFEVLKSIRQMLAFPRAANPSVLR